MEETQKKKGKASGASPSTSSLLHDVLRGVKKKAVVGVPFAHGTVRRGFVVHGKKRAYRPMYRAAASFTVATGSRGKRRVQLRVLLQHRHGFAARARSRTYSKVSS